MIIYSAKNRTLAVDVKIEEGSIILTPLIEGKFLWMKTWIEMHSEEVTIMPDIDHRSQSNPKIHHYIDGGQQEMYLPDTFNLEVRVQQIFDEMISRINRHEKYKQNLQKYKPKTDFI